nr:5011_t:CDS:2 [Entrophospora candida]
MILFENPTTLSSENTPLSGWLVIPRDPRYMRQQTLNYACTLAETMLEELGIMAEVQVDKNLVLKL